MGLFTESFDSYADLSATTGIANRWVVSGGSQSTGEMALTAGRFGGQALRLSSSTDNDTRYRRAYSSLGFQSATFSLNVSLRGSGNSFAHFGVGDGVSPQVNVKIGSDHTIGLYRGGGTQISSNNGTALWVSDPVYPVDTWRTASLKGIIHPTQGELSLAVDGKEIVSLSAINTQNTVNQYVNSVLGNARGAYIDLDDIVCIDDDSEYLPLLKITPRQPSSDGTHLGLTPSSGSSHFAVVDEAVVDASDYLSGDSDGLYDLLGCEDLPTIPASIYAVKAIGYAAKTDVTSRDWNLGVVSDSATDNGDDLTLGSSTSYFEQTLVADPKTDSAWTFAGFNAALLKPTVKNP